MNALERCILSKELQAEILDEEGKHIASIPPMNRGTMVSKNFDRIPWLTATKKFMRRWMRDLFGPSRTR
ncbi:hypothetical protein RBH88_11575 [Aminobacterium sp. MB27-C1]|nr:hypothetical protein [Aminobacterium sp. MB27-C1]WMI71479.1 hypothetical protein RBH88_11575 [Aminobacterium sp. MB27-C1]